MHQLSGEPRHVLKNVRLRVGPSAHFPTARSFGYCTSPDNPRREPPVITVAPDFAKQDVDRQEAILRHELAHAVAIVLDVPEHSEVDADRLAQRLFGSRIYYDSDDVQTIRKTHQPTRPAHLPDGPVAASGDAVRPNGCHGRVQVRPNAPWAIFVDGNTHSCVRRNPPSSAPALSTQAMAQLRGRYIDHLVSRCGLPEARARKLVPRQFGRSPRVALTPDQLDAFNAAVRREVRYQPLAAALLLLPQTGLRVGEMSALQVSDIVHQGSRPCLRVVSGKSDKLRKGREARQGKPLVRVVPLYRKAEAILRDYLSNGRFGVRSESAYLFPGRVNGRISPSTFQRACKALVEREPRLPTALTPHVLRHTFATERLRHCHDVETIQEHMGHKSRKTLFLYVHNVT